jgi:sugar phosphate isomerase/epimerase
MIEPSVTRREALKTAAMAGLMLPLAAALPRLDGQGTPPTDALKPSQPLFELGIATVTFKKLSVDAVIAALQELQVKSVSAFKVHVPILLSTPDVCREMAQKFRAAGIAIASTGVVQLANSESVMRRAFECGRAAGLPMMTASFAQPPDRDTLLLTERFVREYDIRLAFHNHGPEDKIFPSPYDAWNAVQPYDERLGLCIDVGHSARAGVDPVEAILKCRARLYDVHLKDTRAAVGAVPDIPVELGFGRLDIPAILAALVQVGFRNQVGLEDEVESADPIPGVAQSFGFMRGVRAALSRNRPLP